MVSLVEGEESGKDGRKEDGVEPRRVRLSLRYLSNGHLSCIARSFGLEKKSELCLGLSVEVVFTGCDNTGAVTPVVCVGKWRGIYEMSLSMSWERQFVILKRTQYLKFEGFCNLQDYN